MSKANTDLQGRDQSGVTPPVPNAYDYQAIYATARRMRADATWAVIAAAARAIGRLIQVAVIAPYLRWRRREIAYRELMSMEPHMLRDLGITRGDIPYVIGSREDPRYAANENRHPKAA